MKAPAKAPARAPANPPSKAGAAKASGDKSVSVAPKIVEAKAHPIVVASKVQHGAVAQPVVSPVPVVEVVKTPVAKPIPAEFRAKFSEARSGDPIELHTVEEVESWLYFLANSRGEVFVGRKRGSDVFVARHGQGVSEWVIGQLSNFSALFIWQNPTEAIEKIRAAFDVAPQSQPESLNSMFLASSPHAVSDEPTEESLSEEHESYSLDSMPTD